MKFYIACIQKLTETIKNTLLTNESKLIGCPSLRVFEANDFRFLSTTSNNAEQLLKAEDISLQFNSLGKSEVFWDIDPNLNLYEQYKTYLENLKIKDQKLIHTNAQEDLAVLFNDDNTPSKAFESYNQYLLTNEKMLKEYNDLDGKRLQLNRETQSYELIQNQLDQLKIKMQLHTIDWTKNGHKNHVEDVLGKVNKLSDYDTFLEDLKIIGNDIRKAERTGVQSLNTYSKIQIVPYNFYEDEQEWNLLEIAENEVDGLYENAKITQKGFYNELSNFEYEEDFVQKISLQYRVISIKRPWFKSAILNSDFIQSDRDKQAFYYAEKVLLIKKLRVILKSNLPKKEKAKIEANSVIKFGPFLMKNQFFTNKTSKESFIKPVTNKKTLTSKIISKQEKKIIRKAAAAASKNTFTKFHRLKAINKNIPPPRNKHRSKKIKSLIIVNQPNTGSQKRQSHIHFIIKDKLIDAGIYKAEISIKTSSFVKEIETDENGKVSITLPGASYYNVEIRKDGYKVKQFWLAGNAKKNINVNKQLEPQEIRYDSFFLIGIVGNSINL